VERLKVGLNDGEEPKDLQQVVHVLEQETNQRVSTNTSKRLSKKTRRVETAEKNPGTIS